MNDVIRLTDRQYDYLKKLVTDDIQKKIADRDNDATLDRADLLLSLIKIHALAKRGHHQESAVRKELVDPSKPIVLVHESIVKKVCNKCGKEKPLDEFGANSYMKDGKKSTCKACIALYQKERYSKRKGKA